MARWLSRSQQARFRLAHRHSTPCLRAAHSKFRAAAVPEPALPPTTQRPTERLRAVSPSGTRAMEPRGRAFRWTSPRSQGAIEKAASRNRDERKACGRARTTERPDLKVLSTQGSGRTLDFRSPSRSGRLLLGAIPNRPGAEKSARPDGRSGRLVGEARTPRADAPLLFQSLAPAREVVIAEPSSRALRRAAHCPEHDWTAARNVVGRRR